VTVSARGGRPPQTPPGAAGLTWDPSAETETGPGTDELTQPRTGPRRFWHPLVVVCGVQAALSLALVWSNTAYIDEADYLWVGHLVLRNWLHGTSWPSTLIKGNLSGSPFLYPPIGATVDGIGGLAAARILSMLFMIGATIVLYLVAQRLFGRQAALIAAILWSLSEPAFRLAYATYDPLSVFLTTISAWLIVQATFRKRPLVFALAGGFALALANATAYSGIVIDPVVIAFALAVWWPALGPRRALVYTAALGASLLAGFALVMAGTGSFAGTGTIFHRQSKDHQDLALVVREIWSYSGFFMALSLLGILVAFKVESRARAVLVTLLGLAVFTAPVAQFHYGTAWSADKHVAYGFWFAVMAAGYGCAKLIGWPAGSRKKLIAVCGAVALIYPAVYGFEAAWQRYHLWQNSSAFVTALRPVIANSTGDIYVPGHEQNIAQYYLPEGRQWQRWNSALALDPAGLPNPVPRRNWRGYYRKWVSSGRYQFITLFYDTTFTSSVALSPKRVASGKVTKQRLLKLVATNSDEAGVPILTNTLENSHKYQLVADGPYNITNVTGSHNYGIFVIWKRVPGS
jgi:4-amino-4-deoxy-L-arabinose transferase-like glycosyltransferase